MKAVFLTPMWTSAYFAIGVARAMKRAGVDTNARPWLRQTPDQRQKSVHDGKEASLQSTRRAHADQLSHEESEIETARVNE